MRYQKVVVNAIGYELGPVVVSSTELEDRLEPVYKALRIPEGQLEVWTGIRERRFWEDGAELSTGAIRAARKALAESQLEAQDLGALIYTGVCRENFEPATACRIAHALRMPSSSFIYDLSNACLGVMNGMIDVANRIELGQIKAGMVVSCESSREIVDTMIGTMCERPDMETFKLSLATMTGGSGAVAVVLSAHGRSKAVQARLLGGVARAAPEFFELCRWGLEPTGPKDQVRPFMSTDSVAVLDNGVKLGRETWKALLAELDWTPQSIDRVICHQVGSAHRDKILQVLEIDEDKDFCSHEFLGNMGTVSLPLTAALAAERDIIESGDKVGFLGIGSGLNCLMLGLEWS